MPDSRTCSKSCRRWYVGVFGLLAFFVAAALALAGPGDLDVTFDGDGRKVLPEQMLVAGAVAIQPDGKILAVGSGGEETDFLVMRMLPGGVPDASFDGDGSSTIDLGGIDEAFGIALQADGKIIVVGRSGNGELTDAAVVRLTSAGAPDTSFDGDGRRLIDLGPSDGFNAAIVQPDGRIFVAGTGGPNDDFLVGRMQSNGALDGSFDRDGLWTGAFGESDTAKSVALQADGRIVVAGETTLGEDVVVVRLTPGGTPDATFDGDGVKITAGPGNERAATVLLAPDGGILVAGTDAKNRLAVMRLDSLGTPDTGYAGDGQAEADVGGEGIGYAAALQQNGKVVVVGSAGDGSDMAVARFLTTGLPDPTFSGDGRMTIDFGPSEAARAVALQADGRIVVAGSAGFSAVLARIDGDLPPSVTPTTRTPSSVSTPGRKDPALDVDDPVGILGGGPSRQGFGVPTCGGRQATIVGTPGRDRLKGTSGADVIVGRGGADRISGGGGNDRICGGPGRDILFGGTGHDYLSGGSGRDRLFGGRGRDALVGGRGRDLCVEAGRGRLRCETR